MKILCFSFPFIYSFIDWLVFSINCPLHFNISLKFIACGTTLDVQYV